MRWGESLHQDFERDKVSASKDRSYHRREAAIVSIIDLRRTSLTTEDAPRASLMRSAVRPEGPQDEPLGKDYTAFSTASLLTVSLA
jgi:hypothetical protein